MLRSYQSELSNKALSSTDNVLIQGDTGMGKTPVLCDIAKKSKWVLCIAHRKILVMQLSEQLAKAKVKHGVIATKHTLRQCILRHRKLGAEYIAVKPIKFVCSIDSLLSRHRRGLLTLDTQLPWRIIVDEAHHMIEDNKWGKLLKLFPNAQIIGATATPCRLDGISLARSKGGCFDSLLQATELKADSAKTLIDKGYLSPFKCFAIQSRIDDSNLKVVNGEYTYKTLSTETGREVINIAGDAVKNYKALAMNTQALAFCLNIDIAKKTADHFVKHGVSAAAIHSKMSSVEAARVFNLFEQKHIKVLCNVDMIGEGVDIPAITTLMMLRKTASLALYRQWIGRSLRPAENKSHAIILDFVNNILEHDLPDKHIEWCLEKPPQAEKSNLFPCPKCKFLNKFWEKDCAECGFIFERGTDETPLVELKYIDLKLVEIHRKEADFKKLKAEKEWLKNNVLCEKLLTEKLAPGYLGESLNKIKSAQANYIKEAYSISKANDFLAGTNNKEFWIDNFSIQDANKLSVSKAERAYKQWLK
jgi:superfamily II DNA or RNA helicase